MSAREVSHRSKTHFNGKIKDSTLILKNSIGSENEQNQRILRTTMKRAYAFHRTQEYLKAKMDYTTCIKNSPKWDLPYFNRGKYNYYKYIKCEQRRVKYISLACIHYKLRNHQACIRDLDEAIKLNARDPAYVSSRAMLFRETVNNNKLIK